jgi:hypothetical protein
LSRAPKYAPDREPRRQQQRGAHVEVPVLVVLPGAERAHREEERPERRAGGGRRQHAREVEQRRDDDDAAADAEQPTQHSGGEPDGEEEERHVRNLPTARRVDNPAGPGVRPARAHPVSRSRSDAPDDAAPANPLSEGSYAFLKRLLDTPGPSGFESAPARVWREEAAAFAEVSADVVGTATPWSTPAARRPSSSPGTSTRSA